jgi:anti-sigma-K factor RskA
MTDRDEMPPAGEFDDLEALLREVTDDDRRRVAPPAALWDRIESEVTGGEGEPGGELPPEVSRLDDRRRRRRVAPIVIGVAAALLLVVAGFVVVLRDDGSDSTVVARAQLSYDPEQFDALGADATAGAELLELDDGTEEVKLVDATLPSAEDEDADLELWLIRPDADGNVADLVSLGLVDPDDPGTFVVPPDYDPAVFTVVDISVEPRDGEPTHSGRSILRGPFVQA